MAPQQLRNPIRRDVDVLSRLRAEAVVLLMRCRLGGEFPIQPDERLCRSRYSRATMRNGLPLGLCTRLAEPLH